MRTSPEREDAVTDELNDKMADLRRRYDEVAERCAGRSLPAIVRELRAAALVAGFCQRGEPTAIATRIARGEPWDSDEPEPVDFP